MTRVTCACGWTRTYPTRARAEANARRHRCPADRTRGVRRATRSYRCKRCGLEAVYENAGAAEARSWFSKHSCRKHEQATLRHALAQARLATIDRTPKPCLHKQAHHVHGTRACYVLDRCRCEPCSAASTRAETGRNRLKAYGRYHKYVDAHPVRLHVAELAAYGIGLKQIAKLTGVPQGSLWKLVYGKKRTLPDGTIDQTPSRRVLRTTAERIYAVEAAPANLGLRESDHDRTPLARQHLRALVALGWSMSELGRRLGWTHPTSAHHLFTGEGPMARGTVDKAEALFAQLCMTPPAETNQRERIAASRARRYAQDHGWPPPLALPDLADDLADDPADATARPLREAPLRERELDEAAIWRRMHGDRTVRLTPQETTELVRRWAASGRSLNQCESITGIRPSRYYRISDHREEAS